MTTGPAEGGPARDSAGGAAGDPAGGAAAGLASRAAGAQAALRPGAPAPPPGARRVAAIDCGTNSLRLLIADVDPARGELRDLSRRMEIVRLGQGVDATGRIAPDALARTLGVLQEYARAIRQTGATATRMVATSATRDATNAAEFVSGVVGILGVPPEVVSGAAEARLSFTGATTELARSAGRPGDDLPGPYLVIDIGGGSTEFVVGGRGRAAAGPAAARPAETSAAVPGPGPGPGSGSGPGPQPELRAISMDIGCVRMTERHLHHDPPTEAEVAAATADIDAAIDAAAQAVPVAEAATLVGLAGSVTTVAAIALGLPGYDPDRIHHARIGASEVHQVSQRLLAQTRRERAAIGPMHPGRVDVIGAGALVLDRVLTRLGFAEVVASEHDILDGIAWSLAAADNQGR